jgi:hypothetical protein
MTNPYEPRTFQEWKSLNFSVRRGEKSCRRNKDGIPLFDHDQVKENYKHEWEGIDYLADAEFWAKVNPQMLYKQSLAQPHRTYSEKAGAILAKNLS